MEMNSIGLIELTSIASGMQAADIMLKTSEVEFFNFRPSPGNRQHYPGVDWYPATDCPGFALLFFRVARF